MWSRNYADVNNSTELAKYAERLVWTRTFIGVFVIFVIALPSMDHATEIFIKKGEIAVLSLHPGSELCPAYFDKYLSWSFGLCSPYIFIWISISIPWGVYRRSHATWCHGLQIYPHKYPLAHGSREAMRREASCSGAQPTDAPAGYYHSLYVSAWEYYIFNQMYVVWLITYVTGMRSTNVLFAHSWNFLNFFFP